MGVLYDYFAAPSDSVAAAAIDLEGGPGGTPPVPPGWRAAFQSGDREAILRLARPAVRLSEYGLGVLSVKGIDPVVQMGRLEMLLTRTELDVILARERSGKAVAIRDDGERLVLTMTDELTAALSAVGNEQVDAVSVAWLRSEEFSGQGDPETLADLLRELSKLARGATASGQRLYCWACV